nr:immunoglobulin heavy chain junction region [Homo sapiens]
HQHCLPAVEQPEGLG